MRLLSLAAAAERPSEHPLAEAIVRAARARHLDLPEADEFALLAGRGLRPRSMTNSSRSTSPAALWPAYPQRRASPRPPSPRLAARGHTAVVVAT